MEKFSLCISMLAYVAECRLLQLATYTTTDVMYQFTYHVYEMAKYRLFINTYIHNTYCENVRVTLPSPNVSIKQLFLNATSCQGRSWINCYCSAWWATFGEKRSILRKRHCFPQGWNHCFLTEWPTGFEAIEVKFFFKKCWI